MSARPPSHETTKVFIACSGLGRIKRGFEKFAGNCFEQVHSHPQLDVTLFKGGGEPAPRNVPLVNLSMHDLAHPISLGIREAAGQKRTAIAAYRSQIDPAILPPAFLKRFRSHTELFFRTPPQPR